MKRSMARLKKIGIWVASLSAIAKVTLVVILAVLFFGGSYASYRAFNYTQHNPEFCRQCHTMETAWERWSTSEHSKVDCHSCHQVNLVQGAQLVMNYLLKRPDRNTNHAAVPDKACEQCHYHGDPHWAQVADTAGHVIHADENNIACQTCHGLRLHRFRPSTEICVACHSDHVTGQAGAIKDSQMQELHCVECHSFLRTDSPLRPTRETCLSCHQQIAGTVTFPEIAPMKWDCRECHKPHQAEEPVVGCSNCHTNVASLGAHAKNTHSQTACQQCHQPHEWKVASRDQCLACHTDRVEHNSGQLCAQCHDFRTPVAAAVTQYGSGV